MKNVKVNINKDISTGGLEILVDGTLPDIKQVSGANIFVKLITGAIIGFVNGFWGGGGGMICVPLLTQVIGLPDKKAHATTLLVMLPLSLASLIIYIVGGNMLWWEGCKIGIGFIAGGYLGALLLKKISNVWLSLIFSVIIIVGGIKLII